MKQMTYHELNPLIRLKEMELLTTEQMTKMLESVDLKELEGILKKL